MIGFLICMQFKAVERLLTAQLFFYTIESISCHLYVLCTANIIIKQIFISKFYGYNIITVLFIIRDYFRINADKKKSFNVRS